MSVTPAPWRRFASGFVCSWLVALTADPASAEPAESKRNGAVRHRRLAALDYAITGALGAGSLALELGAPPVERPVWSGPILFDGGLRRALALDSRSSRDAAGLASDVTALLPLAIVAGDLGFALAQGGDTFAFVLSIDVQAFALAGILTRSIQLAWPRARPDLDECRKDPRYVELCFRGEYESFPSGHSATAATASGLVCAHHAELDLYGNSTTDRAACATAVTAAIATGVLRVMADRHYTTDVLSGLALGGAFGYALPRLIHYRQPPAGGESSGRTRPRMMLAVMPLQPGPLGLTLFGVF